MSKAAIIAVIASLSLAGAGTGLADAASAAAVSAAPEAVRQQGEPPSYEEAKALLDAGRYPQAVIAFEKRLGQGKRAYDDVMGLGLALFAQHESNRSMGLFFEAAKLRPRESRPIAMVARIEQRIGLAKFNEGRPGYEADLVEAGIHFGEAADLSSDPGALRAEAATCFLTAERYDRARVEIEKARGRYDPDKLRSLELATSFLSGRYGDFMKVSDRALAAGDERYVHLIRRLEALARLERFDDARGLFARLVPEARELGRYEPWMILEKVWQEGRGLAARRRAFESIAAARPDDPLPAFYLAFTYGLSGAFEKSAAAARKTLAAWPKNAAAHRYLATALLRSGRLDEALASLRVSLAERGQDEELRNTARFVVKAFVDKRQFDRALELQELLVAVAPDEAAYVLDRANLMKNVGRLEDAATLLEALCEEARETPDLVSRFYNDYGLALNGLGRTKEAEVALREAIETDPDNLDARENLGLLLFRDERRSEARESFEDVLRRQAEEDPTQAPRWRSRYYLGRLRLGQKARS